MSRILTPEDLAKIPSPSDPWIEPTGLQPVPTPEEMANSQPDPAPEKCRFRWEINVQTGERKAIELTLDEYRARHVAKIKAKNEWFLQKQEQERKARRKALLEAFIDTLEK